MTDITHISNPTNPTSNEQVLYKNNEIKLNDPQSSCKSTLLNKINNFYIEIRK